MSRKTELGLAMTEILNTFPDALLFGSMFMGLITVSLQQTLLFLSFFESFAILYGLQNIYSFIFEGEINKTQTCKSKFHTLVFEDLFSSPSANIPSYAVYTITFACTYLIQSFNAVKNELDVLDINKNQYKFSVSILIFIIFLFAALRLWLSCDSGTAVLLGLLFGSIVALYIHYQNQTLFGKNSVNFLPIPLIRNKTADNEPIYICS